MKIELKEISENQIDLMKHTLWLTDAKKYYRNYFCCGWMDSKHYKDLRDLEDKWFMRMFKWTESWELYFCVTDFWIQSFEKWQLRENKIFTITIDWWYECSVLHKTAQLAKTFLWNLNKDSEDNFQYYSARKLRNCESVVDLYCMTYSKPRIINDDVITNPY